MKFTFIGCSQTEGRGLELLSNSIHNYANIVGGYYDASVKNLAQGGLSNSSMFISAIEEIYNDPPDILFVQWTDPDRFNLYPGPDTQLCLAPVMNSDYNYRKIFFTKKQLQRLADQVFVLNHHYQELLMIIKYCNLIEKAAQDRCQVVFINGLLGWKSDLTIQKFQDYNKQLNSYTKDLLDFANRSDDEIELLVANLTSSFASLNQDLWPNIFENFKSLLVDSVNDHPGIKTNKIIADKIINYIEKRKI